MDFPKSHSATPRCLRLLGILHFPLLFLLLLGLDVAFRAIYPISGAPAWNDTQPLLFSVFWALLLSSLIELLPTLARRIATVLLPLLTGLILLVHGAMYGIFGNFFSFADLSYAGDGARFFSVSYLQLPPALILCLILALLLSILLAVSIPPGPYGGRRPLVAMLLLATSLVGLYGQNSLLLESDKQSMFWDTVYSDTTDQAVYTDFSDVNRCMQLCGSYQYLLRSFLVTYGVEDALKNSNTYEALDAYYRESDKNQHDENSMSGIFAGKNLILVQLESIDTWLLTEDYMPNLYRLQQEGIDFTDYYAPMFTNAGTFGSEFTANTGLISPTTGINIKAYSTYDYPESLANLFRNAGYSANSFHPAAGTIYNREAIHANWGYEAYHSYVEMGMDDYMCDSQMINGYSQMVSDDPFFSFIITYSGHGPYTEALDNISESHWEKVYEVVDPDSVPAQGDDLEEYYRAVAHAMETDDFVGELVDALTQDGHLEDTVLLFYTDHYAKYMTNTDLLMDLKGVENTDMLCRVPCILYSADLSPEKVTKPSSTMDLAPTIANLFGLSVNYAYYPGNDIFGSGGGIVCFRGLNWYDGNIYYSSDYDGEITDYITQTNEYVSTTIHTAWDTMRCNYFARLDS
jgi:phosphoglycerol transferase MdoB-like AlkP superfamily enzyme